MDSQIIDVQLNATLESINVVICNKKYDLTNIAIKGLFIYWFSHKLLFIVIVIYCFILIKNALHCFITFFYIYKKKNFEIVEIFDLHFLMDLRILACLNTIWLFLKNVCRCYNFDFINMLGQKLMDKISWNCIFTFILI